MTKNTKPTSKNAKKNIKRGKPNPGLRLARGLDKPAMDYARLLSDPCNAELVHPLYGSSAAGYLVRTKQIIQAGLNAAAVDSITAFNPVGKANKGDDVESMWCTGYSSSSGGSFGTTAGSQGPQFLIMQAGAYRPVAGCLKVLYNGSELNRSGTVSYIHMPNKVYSSTETLSSNVDDLIPGSSKTVRLGSEPHEFRWVPINPRDQQFTSDTDPMQTVGQTDVGSQMVILIRGAPAGSVTIEATFVWEWTPITNVGTANAAFSTPIELATPRTSTTVSTVLKYLSDAAGGLQAWATAPATHAVMNQVGNGIYNVVKSSARLALAV